MLYVIWPTAIYHQHRPSCPVTVSWVSTGNRPFFLQVLRFRDVLVECHVSTAEVNPVVTRSASFPLVTLRMHPLYGWQDLLEFMGWNNETAGGSEPTDIITFNWHSGCGLHCCRMRACDVRGWDDLKVHGHMAVLIWQSCTCGLFSNVCVHVSVCTTVQECFPICLLCVFKRDEKALCSHVCWQEVRHSCTRPWLVSVRILCSFASTHFCLVFFSFVSGPFKVLETGWFVFILYALSLDLHHLPPLAYVLSHPWLVVWQRGNCANSPLTVSCLIQPLCQSCIRLPKEDSKPCSPLIQ